MVYDRRSDSLDSKYFEDVGLSTKSNKEEAEGSSPEDNNKRALNIFFY